MADRKLYSGLSKKHVLVPAYSVATVDYIDTRPNYFQVQNQGTTAIYCGTASIPNNKQYDFMVAAESLRMFTEPHDRTRLYIFNPSGSDIMTVVLSFNAPFDPLALALSTIEVSMPSEIEANSVITGFHTSLPAGSNHIGNVGLPGDINAAILSAGNRNYQNTLDVIKGNQKDYTTVLANILAAIGNIEGGTSGSDGSSNVKKVIRAYTANATETGIDVVANWSANVVKIHTISNDGEGDITVTLTSVEDSTPQAFILKGGETLNDLEGEFSRLAISGADVPFRVLASIAK